MIRHTVHLRFKPGLSDTDKQHHFDALAGLVDQIDGIHDFQVRRNVSTETLLVRGLNDLFWFDFRDLAVRDAYLENEAHKAVGAALVKALAGGADGIFVCDVEL